MTNFGGSTASLRSLCAVSPAAGGRGRSSLKAVVAALAVSLLAGVVGVLPASAQTPTTTTTATSTTSTTSSPQPATITPPAVISSPLLGGSLPAPMPGASFQAPTAAVANKAAAPTSQITPTNRSAPDSPYIDVTVPGGKTLVPKLLAAGTRATNVPAASASVLPTESATASYAQNADGSITAAIANGPVHYQNAAGAWKNIDLSLVSGAGGALTATSAPAERPDDWRKCCQRRGPRCFG